MSEPGSYSRDSYISATKNRIAYFYEEANRFQRRYRWNRVCVFGLGALTPASQLIPTTPSTDGYLKAATSLMSLAMTGLITFESQFRLSERWRHNRTAELSLNALLRRYIHADMRATDEAAKLRAYDRFFDDVEGFREQEQKGLWPLVMAANQPSAVPVPEPAPSGR